MGASAVEPDAKDRRFGDEAWQGPLWRRLQQSYLLIAGIGGNLDMWEPLIRELPNRRIVAFDVPGTGDSDLLPTAPLMASYAWFTRRLLDRLGYAAVDVLGHSWGGLLAQHLAIQHPRRVRRLVLVGTAPGLGSVPPSPQVLWWMLTPLRYYSSNYLRRIAPDLYGGAFRHDSSLIEADLDRRMGRPPRPEGYLVQLLAMVGYSTLPALWAVRVPTLVLAGDDDPVIPTANPRLLAAAIRDAELVVVPGAGHMLPFERAAMVAGVAGEFLDRP